MNPRPKISVVIPTCNARNSVKTAVLSVLNQDFENLEVVVVDDNPADFTSVLTAMFDFDSRVKVVRNFGNHGPSQARNFGVQSTVGELVAFLDDDDCYLAGRLGSLVSCYDKTGDKYSFISSGRFVEVDDFSDIKTIPGQKFGVIALKDLLHGNSIDIGFLMKKSFFEELGCFDESLSSLEDWDLFIRALKVKDGFKIKRFDYAVNRTDGRNRVSKQEQSGYFDIANKYSDEFGENWTFIPKAKGLSLAGLLSFSKASLYSYRASSFVPAKLYLSSRFPRLIRIVKELFCRR